MEGAGQSPVLQVRMTQAQKDKAIRLGGAVWVRKMIDKAKEPHSVNGVELRDARQWRDES